MSLQGLGLGMKSIRVEETMGFAVCNGISEISTDKFKKLPLRRGHIVKNEDINQLLKTGEENLSFFESDENILHEDEAARYVARATFEKNIALSESAEGRVDIIAKRQGLLKINLSLLEKLNNIPHLSIATSQNMQEVYKGKVIGGTMALPELVREDVLQAIVECSKDTEPLFTVLKFKKHKLGLIKTGTDVCAVKKESYGKILKEKFTNWNSEILYSKKVSDNSEEISAAIEQALSKGADFLVLTGGMMNNANQNTSAVIKSFATHIVTDRAPVFPGALFMLAYRNDIPIIGLPNCALQNRTSVLDLVVPRILAGLQLDKRDILNLAHGGLCDCD